MPVDASAPALRRAAFGRVRRLVVLRLDPELPLEDNLARLREALRRLRLAGRPSAPPEAPSGAPAPGAARVALFYLLGLFGPLLAARAITVSRATAAPVCHHGWSQASPVPQAVAGALASWATACGAGFIAAWLLPPEARETLARSWTTWTYAAPLAVGAAALYLGDGAAAMPGWRATLRVRHLAALAALLAAAAQLLNRLAPRSAPRAFGRRSAASAPRRTGCGGGRGAGREALVGVPCLLAAFALVETNDPSRPASGFSDPRGWLALGLLAPAGAVVALGAGAAPPLAALGHGLVALALGGALAAFVAAGQAYLRAWARGPKHDRTIDLDDGTL